MSSLKRKKYSKDIRCVFFPDDVKNGVKKVGEPSLSSSSTTKSWERCGDSFLGIPITKNLNSSGRKLSAIRKLHPSSFSVHNGSIRHEEDPVHIAWTSSESEQSDEESPKKSEVGAQQPQERPRKTKGPTVPLESYSGPLSARTSNEEELPIIDSDSDLNSSAGELGHISDFETEPHSTDGNSKALSPKPIMLSRLDNRGEAGKKSISVWVRAARAMLQTPRKRPDRQSQTPEDSVKKKRKLQSGGFAERLNRLQRRQKSAFSFRRHLSISEDPSASTVDRPGVLVLEVVEIWEESSMQLAHCEHRRAEGQPGGCPPPALAGRLLVLFDKETAAQLMPAPRDIIHVYPPWQRLDVDDESATVILNTHFSQKVFSASKATPADVPRSRHPPEKRSPYPLTNTFGLHEVASTMRKDVAKQVGGGPGGLCRPRDSLLEVIEGLGPAGSVGPGVRVVVQRVYSIHVPERPAASTIRPKAPSSAASPQRGRTRLCALLQDAHGIFSVVQLHVLTREEELREHGQRWQGKACTLRSFKVVQRVTRERCTRLFHLIDGVWPPAIPLQEGRAAGPAPCFCYLLSGQEGSVEVMEDQPVSPMYLPPIYLTLRNILQSAVNIHCCSFIATVVYRRMQSENVGQSEVWLTLTDPSLQEGKAEGQCRRTVALCISTSCVLTSSVVGALRSPAACVLSFRDVVRENGALLCTEQSLVQIQPAEPGDGRDRSGGSLAPSPTVPVTQAPVLPRPVRLDPLGPETTANSLCTLTGVIVGVDESTAYSWPACTFCGSDHLEITGRTPQAYHCTSCKSAVQDPTMNIQLEVTLSSSIGSWTVKAKLQQTTILSLLNSAALDGNEFPGYEVEHVLGKEVGPIPAYVRVVSRKPALWIGVEEICL